MKRSGHLAWSPNVSRRDDDCYRTMVALVGLLAIWSTIDHISVCLFSSGGKHCVFDIGNGVVSTTGSLRWIDV